MSYWNNYNRRGSKTYKDENGYLRFKDSGKLVSRWAAEEKLGRPLYPEEVVHHIDRNKLNNSRENLWVFKNQRAHDSAHEYDAERYGRRYSYGGRRWNDDYYYY